jgi:hypothetical protein
LRIDDGSIYPKELLTPEEAEYQAWLSERYPEVDAVKARGLYLDADYLSRPEENDMLIDKYFHISHCVHSMRRYWVAKETGKRLLCQKEYPQPNGIRSSYMPHGSFALAHEPLLEEYSLAMGITLRAKRHGADGI